MNNAPVLTCSCRCIDPSALISLPVPRDVGWPQCECTFCGPSIGEPSLTDLFYMSPYGGGHRCRIPVSQTSKITRADRKRGVPDPMVLLCRECEHQYLLQREHPDRRKIFKTNRERDKNNVQEDKMQDATVADATNKT